MFLKGKKHTPDNLNAFKVKKKTKWFRRFVLTFLLLLLIAGLFFTSRLLQSKGYTNLFDFVSTITSNYFKGTQSKPETIYLQIDHKAFKKLEKNRDRALERGVIINDIDGEFVSGILEYKGKKSAIKLRLKGHMTDHLQKDKWSFRIKMKENKFMGMKRFSIQHPGTRGYIYEWIYHEWMKREGIIALRYKFIDVVVNGRDWGIYAVEENFETELIENNHREKGPILRFNPDLYWINRFNEYTGVNSYDEYATYYSANPEAYREENVLADSMQKNYFLKALAIFESLRSKKIRPAQAFDIKKLANFHAIIDLVGGEHSIDWSDIKYYYNPVTGKLEPVAYESFTNLNSRELTSFYKYVTLDSASYYGDWHSMIFSDPVFFSEYIRQLERMSKPEYLNDFFKDVQKELAENLAIIYKEFPFKKFDKDAYYRRQAMISRLINPPKAVHAYLKKVDRNGIVLQVAAIDALPVQLISMSFSGLTVSLPDKLILPAKQPNAYVNYTDVLFKVPADYKWKNEDKVKITLTYCIPGSMEKKEITVFPYPHTAYEFIKDDSIPQKGNVQDFGFLKVNDETGIITIAKGKNVIDKDLIIPAGYHILGNEAASIDVIRHARLISYSPFFLQGTEDEPFVIGSSDQSAQSITILYSGKSVFKNVAFKNIGAISGKKQAEMNGLSFYQSPVLLNSCYFYNCRSATALNLVHSGFELKNCSFQNVETAVNINYSNGTINDCVIERYRKNGIATVMTELYVNNLYIEGPKESAMNIGEGTQLKKN